MRYERSFPGRFSSLEKISLFVKQAAEETGLDELQVYSVELAVDEACSNIIEHAYGGENIGPIRLELRISAEGLEIMIHDRGKPFNPDSVPSINIQAPLEKRSPGGAGIFLMRKVMDEVHYSFGRGGNTLRMLKRK